MRNERKLLLYLLLFFIASPLWSQSGPYPAFEFPKSENWAAFDTVSKNRQLISTLVWRPKSTNPMQGILISPRGLVLISADILDETLQKKESWLADKNGLSLSLDGTQRLAALVSVEDVTDLVLEGVSDSIPPAARSIRVANNLLKHNLNTKISGDSSFVRSFYQGNRYYHYRWQYYDTRLVGQVVESNGSSFALLRLISDSPNQVFPYLPIADKNEVDETDLFIGGIQTFPQRQLSSPAFQLYYAELLPLIREAQLVVNAAWQKSDRPPEWLERLETAQEAEAPLQPFAEISQALAEAQKQEANLLDQLKEDRDRWYRYQQLIQSIEKDYRQLSPLLFAKTIAEDIIPTHLQLFRLLRFLIQWEKTSSANPALIERRKTSFITFLEHFYANFNPSVDQIAAGELFQLYLDKTQYDLQSPFVIEQWLQANKNSQWMAEALYQKSAFVRGEKIVGRAKEDFPAFLKEIKNDYAYRFLINWREDHKKLVDSSLKATESALKEKERKLTAAMLRYLPQKTAVEKGGFSFALLPAASIPGLNQVSPHYLGNFPENSPIINENAKLAGISSYKGEHLFFSGKTSNQILPIDFLRTLEKTFPEHPVVLEIFGGKK